MNDLQSIQGQKFTPFEGLNKTSKTSRASMGCTPKLALANPPDLNQMKGYLMVSDLLNLLLKNNISRKNPLVEAPLKNKEVS